jgi:lipopolysaccharide export system permease protein
MKTIKTQENSTKDLIKCYLNLKNNVEIKTVLKNSSNVQNCNLNNLTQIIKEIYKRLIVPLYIPLLMLVSLLLINFSKENIKYKKNKIAVFCIGLLMIIISETSISLIQDTVSSNMGFVILPIVSSFFVYLYFLYKFKISQRIQ